MKDMNTLYEWGVEMQDAEGDIIDSDYFEMLNDVPGNAKDMETNHELVLVKTVWNTVTDDMQSRAWAYLKDGQLPDEFDNGDLVPIRFHAEFNNYNKGA